MKCTYFHSTNSNIRDYFRSKFGSDSIYRAPQFTGPKPFPPRGPVNRGFHVPILQHKTNQRDQNIL